MIDYAKRKTLKIFAAVGTAAAAMTAASGSLAKTVLSVDEQAGVPAELPSTDRPLADISVSTRVSSTTNDLEVVLTNTGDTPTTITQVTPREMLVNRGRFDFTRLLQAGDLHLQSGQSVSVPMEPVAVSARSGSHPGGRPTFAVTPMADTPTLAHALRKNLSVVTEGDAWAKVTIMDNAHLA